MHFFCDESGQTGSNYLDMTQPFYILGGWLKPENIDEEKLKREFDNIKKGNEIKSSKLVKNPKGRDTLLKLIKLAISFNLIPVYCIVEKRFAIAARMVDELLDPEYNKLVPYSITYDEWHISKYDLAIIFYSLPDDIINDFAKSYSEHDISGVISCVNRMVIYFENTQCSPLAKIVENSLKCINDNPAFFDDDNDSHIFSHKIDKEKAVQSANWFTFYTLLDILDKIATEKNIVISITHDEQHTYDTSFSSMFNVVTDGEDYITHFQNKPTRVVKNKLTTLDFVNSKHSEYIQLSDALVGSWNYILKYAVDDTLAVDESTRNLAETVLSLITSYNYLHWMVSEKVTSKLSGVFKLYSK